MTPRRALQPLSLNRVAGTELSLEHKHVLYGRARAGESAGEIAIAEALPKSTVQKVLRQGTTTGSLALATRVGRPKIHNDRDDRKILRIIRINPKITYAGLRREAGLEFSRSTYYRILRANGITNWLSKKRPLLTKGHAMLRLAFARKWAHLTEDEWLEFIFSDECSVKRGKGKKRQWSFGTPAQKWDADKIETYNKSKGLTVMV